MLYRPIRDGDMSQSSDKDQYSKKNIYMLVTDYCMASCVAGLKDLFAITNFCGVEMEMTSPLIQLHVITPTGEPVTAYNGDLIHPTEKVNFKHFNRRVDCLIIAPIMTSTAPPIVFQQQLDTLQPLMGWLKKEGRRNTFIASACTGSFFLAEAGLLDGQVCTTHWRAAHVFKERYPQAVLCDEELITDNGQIVCSGGASSYLDLGLYMLSELFTQELANACAKLMVYDPGRDKQSPYQAFIQYKQHDDAAIIEVQNWLEGNYEKEIVIEQLGDRFGLSTRTFKRRFKAASGETPSVYLQKIRIEAAKNQLAMTRKSNQDIVWYVGYEDLSSFRRLFKKHVGVTMDEYRRRFRTMA